MGEIVLKSRTQGSTLVSNVFIDDYIQRMNEAQIKIYLYLLRSISAGVSITPASIADKFNYMETDIIRALKYLDRCGLLSVEFGEGDSIISICVNDCCEKVGDAPEKTHIKTISPASMIATKPFYPADRLREFKERSDVKQLLYMTETLRKKPLSAGDTNTLLYIYDELGFDVDLIEYLVEYCVNCGKLSMDQIKSEALSWAEKGFKDRSTAKLYATSSRYTKEGYMVLKAMGITSRSLVPDDIDYVTRWIDEYGVDTEVILEACRRTVSQISKPSFSYADSIIKRWHEAGVHHIGEIAALDDAYKASKSSPRPANNTNVRSVSKNRFKNFDERDTDLNALAEEIMKKQIPF